MDRRGDRSAKRISGQEKQEKVYGVFEKVAGGYDSANVRISLGMQALWKRMLIGQAVKACEGIKGRRARILDLCTGTGDIAVGIAERLPQSRVVGMDFSPSMLRAAARKAREKDLVNVRWRRGNAMEIPVRDAFFDSVSISFGLRNCADTDRVLREIHRVLRPGGTVLCLDSFVPDSALVRPFYHLYFRHVMPLVGGGRALKEEYEWLQESTEEFLRAGELADRMRDLGFEDVKVCRRMMGACVLHTGTKTQNI